MKTLVTTAAVLLFAASYATAERKVQKTVAKTNTITSKEPVCHSGICRLPVTPSPAQPVVRSPSPQPEQPVDLSRTTNRLATPNAIVWESDIRKAAAQAARTGQPMFVSVSASWCHFCVKMKNETYTNSAVIDRIGTDFIGVQIDADREHELVKRLGIKSLPAIAIISPERKVQSMIMGFKNPTELLAKLSTISPKAPVRRDTPISPTRAPARRKAVDKASPVLRVERIDPKITTR